MKRVLILTNIPSSYRLDLFNELSNSNKGEFEFLFIPEKSVSHKNLIWADTDNAFYKKTTIISDNGQFFNCINLFKFLRKRKYDKVVVGALPYYLPVLILYKIIYSTKIYTWWAGTKNTEKNSKLKMLYRKLTSVFLNGAFFYSNYSKDYFLHNIRKNVKNSYVIGNNTRFTTIELNKINELKKNKLDVDNKELSIISVGFQEERKNTILLLKAVQLLQQEHLFFKTTIVGDGPELERLKDFAKVNQLKNVFFTGNIVYKDVFRLMLQSDLLVHSSISDSWPQVFNEASYCDLAILVSENSGIDNDYTRKFRDTVVFNSNDLEELTSKLRHIISEPNLINDLKSASLEIVEANDGNNVLGVLIKELT